MKGAASTVPQLSAQDREWSASMGLIGCRGEASTRLMSPRQAQVDSRGVVNVNRRSKGAARAMQ